MVLRLMRLLLDLRPWLNDPTHVLLVTRVSWRTGFSPLVPGSSSLSLFSLALKEPRPAWEARTDELERPGGVSCRVGQGRRRRRVAHLAWQVEEVYHKAKRDQGSTSLTASHSRLELGQLGRHGSPRAP
eukprot:scaffold758_cov387-Pavlova_lutheri.AAC.7